MHGLPSSGADGVPGVHAPAWQVSACVHSLSSLQGAPFGRLGFEQTPVAGLQTPESWHWSEAKQTTGFAPVHAPAWHESVCVHASSSLHAVPSALAGFEQVPVPGSQLPASWHWSLATQTTGFEPVHVPAWQVSPCVQASASLHTEPSAFAGFEQTPVAGLQVPTS